MSTRLPESRPQLHLLTDPTVAPARLLEVVEAAVRSGVDVVHVRDKTIAARPLLALVNEIQLAVDRRARVVVNDRLDVALAASADGVQLASHSLPINAVRRLVGDAFVIGASAHSPDEARSAGVDGATFVLFGHVFASPSHPGVLARGLDALRDVVACASTPVIAIGGMQVDRISAALAAGAQGVAVISSVFQAADPAEATRSLRFELDAWNGHLEGR